MKRCEYCHYGIEIEKGHYVNVYTAPAEMHSYHLWCYNDYIAMKTNIPRSTISSILSRKRFLIQDKKIDRGVYKENMPVGEVPFSDIEVEK